MDVRNFLSFIDGNKNPTILKEIFHINFPVLKDIYISNNGFGTIEQFSRIFMPSLEMLIVGANELTRVRDFRKGYWLSLRDLEIRNCFCYLRK